MNGGVGVDETQNLSNGCARAAVACGSNATFRDRDNASPMICCNLGSSIGRAIVGDDYFDGIAATRVIRSGGVDRFQ